MKSAFAVGIVAALLVGCGEEPTPGVEVVEPPSVAPVPEPGALPDAEPTGDPGGELIPEAGGLPSTLRVKIDGVRVPARRVEEALRSEWAAQLAAAPSAADPKIELAIFFAAPRERCAQLLREIAIEQEAARLFDKLLPAEVDALEARLRAAGQLLWFEQVEGAAAARAYVERVHRRGLFEAMYIEASEEVGGEEVFAVYQAEVLEGLPDAAEREGVDVSFEKHGPLIRARLQRVRGLVDLNLWASEVAAAMKLQIVLPDGTRLE